MQGTKIRWAEHTWNAFTGCTKISPGCDNCYAETIAEKFRGNAFPNGFLPTYKPNKLGQPRTWKDPARIFVNSMSDVHHPDFTRDQVDSVYDVMLEVDRHDYLLLTKRPNLMAAYLLGDDGYLARRGLEALPDQIWIGTTIELDAYTWRADHLRRIPALVRFLSCEPLLGPLPSLDLDGLSWVISGGESGPGYRPLDHDWCRDLRDRCGDEGVAYYHKQDAAPRTEMRPELDGRLHEEYPLPHPADRTGPRWANRDRWTGRHSTDEASPRLPMGGTLDEVTT